MARKTGEKAARARKNAAKTRRRAYPGDDFRLGSRRAGPGGSVDRTDIILRKAAWRLIPVMAVMYIVSYLDRSNISFAALTMNQDLGFSPEIYGRGAGIFFWGYFLFEVPSNLMLEKVGARMWIGRIMLTWGLVSTLTAFVHGA